MSADESKNPDLSEGDTLSLQGSMEGSPTRKVKKKKKHGLFHIRSKKNEKRESMETVHNGVNDVDIHVEQTQVTTTTAMTKSVISIQQTTHQTTLDRKESPTPSRKMIDSDDSKSIHDAAGEGRKMNQVGNKKNAAPTHKLYIHLLSGENLAARDANGKSDPYVKVKVDGKTVRKSKCCKLTLDPRWDEQFHIPLNINSDVTMHVYDWDRGMRDDFMGSAALDLTRCDVTSRDVTLQLEDPSCDEDLGFLHISVSLTPLQKLAKQNAEETDGAPSKLLPPAPRPPTPVNTPELPTRRVSDVASLALRKRTGSSMRTQPPVALATVQLVSGTDLPARDANGLSDPYVKLQLGKVKRKSKVCYKTLNPVWKEEYMFHLTSKETSIVDVTVWDRDVYRRDDFIGRCELDLWSLSRDETHSLSMTLVDTQGSLLFLVTVHEVAAEQKNLTTYDLSELRQKYALSSTLRSLKDVGFVEVRVVSASGLKSADINGKSDPFCVAQLCNARAQTQTCYKTLDPVWNRVCTFPLRDVHDVLELLIFDQDKDSEREFLGRVSIPVLRVSSGKEKSYVLKDRKLKDRSKGTVTLQISYIYNPVRAAIRTFSPREERFMEEQVKFKKNLLLNNFHRVWALVQVAIATAEFVNSCFTWEIPRRSAFAFITFLLIAWNFELYMFPIALLLLFLKNYIDIFVRRSRPHRQDALDETSNVRAEDDEPDDEAGKLSLMQRLNALQDVLTKVQNILDTIASFGERVYNTFTWTVPFLSTLAVIVLCVASLILYLIPVRVLVLIWGVNKFTKRLRKPDYVPNNELMDFLSRIPSNVQLDEYRELKVSPDSPKGSKKKR